MNEEELTRVKNLIDVEESGKKLYVEIMEALKDKAELTEKGWESTKVLLDALVLSRQETIGEEIRYSRLRAKIQDLIDHLNDSLHDKWVSDDIVMLLIKALHGDR